jgi:hypothetical protein
MVGEVVAGAGAFLDLGAGLGVQLAHLGGDQLGQLAGAAPEHTGGGVHQLGAPADGYRAPTGAAGPNLIEDGADLVLGHHGVALELRLGGGVDGDDLVHDAGHDERL